MAHISRAIEDLLIGKLFVAPPARKMNSAQGFFLLSALFVCMGLSFLLYGAHMWLSGHYSPEATAAITGGLCLGLALFIGGGAAYISLKYRALKIKIFRLVLNEEISSAMSLLDEEFGETIRDNPKISLLIASVVGFIIEAHAL